MKKLLIILNLALAFSFFNSTHPNDDLIEAINNINLEKVEKLLNKQSNISKEQQEKLLTAISQIIKICKKSTKSFGTSKIDLFRFLLGLTCLSIGVPSAAFGGLLIGIGTIFAKSETVKKILMKKAMNDPKFRKNLAKSNMNAQDLQSAIGKGYTITGIPLTIFGLAISWFGIHQTRKGWNLFSARNRLKKARKIQEIIEKHFAKI